MSTNFSARYAIALSRMCEPVRLQDGASIGEIKAAEKRLGLSLPKALSTYYRVLGKHKINFGHNRLARLGGRKKHDEPLLARRENWLYFMEENQVVCEWAIKVADCARDDPNVFQGQEGDGRTLYREGKCSEFLIASLYWQGCMGGANFSAATRASKKHIRSISRNYAFLGELGGVRNYGNDSLVIGIAKNELYVATRYERSFEELVKLLKVDWNYSSRDN
jgi:hypothetical protein